MSSVPDIILLPDIILYVFDECSLSVSSSVSTNFFTIFVDSLLSLLFCSWSPVCRWEVFCRFIGLSVVSECWSERCGLGMAPKCCVCNSSGKCVSYSCKKGQRLCKNCGPGVHGRCLNRMSASAVGCQS